MAQTAQAINVYVERGAKRTFAGALEWPGWCRSGRDEAAALQALVDYAPRYAAALHTARLSFELPVNVAALRVVERLPGTATTDFGAPDASPAADAAPVDAAGLQRFAALLRAGWQTLDAALLAAAGHTLRSGPRGGGRDAAAIARHVYEAERAYLARLGVRVKPDSGELSERQLAQERQAAIDALGAGARGDFPAHGPRGGKIWTARYFVRRMVWHALDHAWEIEDRIVR